MSTSDEVADFVTADRVIVFADSVATHGPHLVSVGFLRFAGSNSSDIVSITPAVDLLDGAVYNFTLEYQDRAGNPVASTINDRVGYSGNHTLTPTFIHPQSTRGALIELVQPPSEPHHE